MTKKDTHSIRYASLPFAQGTFMRRDPIGIPTVTVMAVAADFHRDFPISEHARIGFCRPTVPDSDQSRWMALFSFEGSIAYF